MSEKAFKVAISGPGISIEREVEEGVIPRLVAILVGGTSPAGSDSAASSAARESSSGTTIAEFLADLNISGNAERIAGIALFLRDVLKRNRVRRDELAEWFQRAGEPAPRNLPRDIRSAVTQRLIAEDHARTGEYLVTETGVRALQGAKGPAPARSAPKASKRRARSASTARPTEAAGDGPLAKIKELIGEAWFKTPRTVAELIEELASRGGHYKSSGLAFQMQQLTKGKALRRKKHTPDGANRPVWQYSNW